MKVLLKMPAWLLSALIRLQRLLDAWGLLPSAFVEHDPLYTSVFLANLGSIDMDAGYHHLYEYGNCPIFMVMGRARNEVVAGEGGRIEVRRQITVRYSFDERVEDGLYCASALQRFKELFENPVD
jgi:hypothetical protein